MSKYLCRVCGSCTLKTKFLVREMMFGMRESFEYDQCDTCLSIQMSSIIDDLSKYYPPDYYSFNVVQKEGTSFIGRLSRWIAAERDRATLFRRKSVVGTMAEMLRPSTTLWSILRHAGIQENARVLDVGCGSGILLDLLSRARMKNLVGIDPFIERDTFTPAGVPTRKCSVQELEGTFDLVMYNHVLEHVPQPKDELLAVHRLLNPGGVCLIRIPTPSSEVFEIYGADWVEFDAPRHLTLISRRGMNKIAESSGFSLESIIDDATGWTYLASELYRLDIPLRDQDISEHFSAEVINGYTRRARKANASNHGGRAAFILRRIDS